MRSIKYAGAIVAAVLATSVVGVAGASAALPEFSTSGTFTGTSGAGKLETVGGSTVTCKKDKSSGSFSGKTVSNVKVTFEECETTLFGFFPVSCTNIVTKTLSGELGYINKSTKTVGLDLKPASGSELANTECGGVTIVVDGSVIGQITPTKTKTTKYTLTYTQSEGKQTIQKFEGGPTDTLSASVGGGAFEEAGEETTESITATEGEIKA